MVKRSKVIISETVPTIEVIIEPDGTPRYLGIAGVDTGFLWFKPSAKRFYQVVDTDPLSWEEVPIEGDAGDINFTGTVSADGDAGITGSKTLGGYTITFKKGILTGFAPV